MNYIKKNLCTIILLTFMLALPVLSLADSTLPVGSDASTKIVNPIKSTTLVDLIKTILEGIIKIGMPVIVLAIIYSGFLFVSARGKPEKLEEAKKALLYTLIGAAILLGSWAIAQLISDTVLAL